MARTLNQLEAVAAWEEARATFSTAYATAYAKGYRAERLHRLTARLTARINRRMVTASRAINPKYKADPNWDSRGYFIGPISD